MDDVPTEEMQALVDVVSEAALASLLRGAVDDAKGSMPLQALVGMVLVSGLAIGVHAPELARRLTEENHPFAAPSSTVASGAFLDLMRERIQTNRRAAQAGNN